MSKNKNTKSVVITIIITLIVLGCLTFAALQFLVPAYVNANGQGSVKTKIYETAVKIFPLLVGIVLIVIASMIANSRNADDEEDDEDKLPPNSYDRQLFESPSDDPTKAKPAAGKEENAGKESFFQMFESHDKPAAQSAEQPVPEAAPAEEPAAEEPAAVVPEPEAEPEVGPVAEPAADAPVVDAIYALIRKLDDLTDMMSVEEEEDDEDDLDDYEYYADQQEAEEAEEDEGVSRIEEKLDKLCEVVSNLASVISARPAIAAPVAEAPAKKEKPAKEVKTVEVEVPVDKKLNDIDPQDPMQRAKIEYDSAKECFYDITYAFTKESADKVSKALPESAYVLSIKGKTVVIVPFLDKAEAEAELDKMGAKYDSVFVNSDDPATFDEVIAPKL